MLCDIGNGTMNIMFINDKKPNPHRCFTEKFGTHQCMLPIRENLMKLYIVGGGGCMIRNFAEYNESRITVNDDICATAKGYERMLEMKLIKNGGAL